MKKGFIIFSVLTTLFLFLFLFSASARVSITSYCDVTLESCRAQDQALALLVEKYPHDVDIDYLYYFDTDNAKSSMAQIALECAHRQSQKNDYKAELQNNLDDLSRDALKEYAANIGLVAANFSFCLDTQMTAWDVLEEVVMADDDGVTSAPTVRFNMDLYSGSQTFTSLHALTKKYLELNGADMDTETVASSETIEGTTQEESDHPFVDPEPTETPVSPSETGAFEESEKPLFFRVIDQIKTWWFDFFSSAP